MDEKEDKSIIVEIGRYREKDENVYTLNIFFLCVVYFDQPSGVEQSIFCLKQAFSCFLLF